MQKRLLVTGCGGFVAGSVVAQAGDPWTVHALSRGEPLLRRPGLTWHSFDLCETERLRDVFRQVQPDAVIHAAALADIDYCQTHQDVAEQVNVGVTRELARLCRDGNAKLVFCSTDTVFDGERGLYHEDDPPSPVNVYAETKARAEAVVAEEADEAIITRLSLVMGLAMLRAGNSFLSKMVAKLAAGEEVAVPQNEIRTPIDVITLGRALLELADGDFSGTIHLAGNDRLDRFMMARRIAERMGYSPELIVATDSNATPGRAPRPRDASLDNAKARRVLRTPMCSLIEGLELILAARQETAE